NMLLELFRRASLSPFFTFKIKSIGTLPSYPNAILISFVNIGGAEAQSGRRDQKNIWTICLLSTF
ncbi:MAG TPA: hypothetical protein VK517_17205, partial [Cyclobacteriaceae bacterium]|nr:hypothetical protein [Cyclobacteriaceae bacterium]